MENSYSHNIGIVIMDVLWKYYALDLYTIDKAMYYDYVEHYSKGDLKGFSDTEEPFMTEKEEENDCWNYLFDERPDVINAYFIRNNAFVFLQTIDENDNISIDNSYNDYLLENGYYIELLFASNDENEESFEVLENRLINPILYFEVLIRFFFVYRHWTYLEDANTTITELKRLVKYSIDESSKLEIIKNEYKKYIEILTKNETVNIMTSMLEKEIDLFTFFRLDNDTFIFKLIELIENTELYYPDEEGFNSILDEYVTFNEMDNIGSVDFERFQLFKDLLIIDKSLKILSFLKGELNKLEPKNSNTTKNKETKKPFKGVHKDIFIDDEKEELFWILLKKTGVLKSDGTHDKTYQPYLDAIWRNHQTLTLPYKIFKPTIRLNKYLDFLNTINFKVGTKLSSGGNYKEEIERYITKFYKNKANRIN